LSLVASAFARKTAGPIFDTDGFLAGWEAGKPSETAPYYLFLKLFGLELTFLPVTTARLH
jgi:hypothetical protein